MENGRLTLCERRGAFKDPPPLSKFCPHDAFIFGAMLLCFGDFSQKTILHRVAKHFD